MSQILPHNLEAERSLIGSAFDDPGVFALVKGHVQDVEFYLEKHRKLWGRMVALHEAGHAVDFVTVSDSFRRENGLEELGGLKYITSLTDLHPLSSNALSWAAIIRRDALRRESIQALQVWSERLMGSDGDHRAEMAELSRVVTGLAEKCAPVASITPLQLAKTTFEMVDREVYEDRAGWSTGMEAVDESWGYLQPKKTYQVYARSKMGKSVFGASVAANLAAAGVPVQIWTGEMSAQRYLLRMAAGMARVNIQALKKRKGLGGRPMEEWEVAREMVRLRDQLQEMGSWSHLLILDDRRMTAEGLEASARRHFTAHGPGVALADYLQKLQPSKPQGSREQEIRDISQGLMAMAHHLECAVLSFGQLNRGGFQRSDPRPQQDDIREGDAPLFDADVFCFLHRQVYYEARKTGKMESECEGHRDAELIVTANRDGEMGVIPLHFYGEYSLIEGKEKKNGKY